MKYEVPVQRTGPITFHSPSWHGWRAVASRLSRRRAAVAPPRAPVVGVVGEGWMGDPAEDREVYLWAMTK